MAQTVSRKSSTAGVSLLHTSGMDIGSYFTVQTQLHRIAAKSSRWLFFGNLFYFLFVDRTLQGGRKQCRALRVVFSDVSKSTLLTNNGLSAVLGPLLVGPDRGLSPTGAQTPGLEGGFAIPSDF